MSELKMEHISPYGGSRLKLKTVDELGIQRMEIMTGIDWDNNRVITKIPGNFVTMGYSLDEVKPVLRPLHDICEEINHNGLKFKPAFYWNDDPVHNTIHMTLSTLAQYGRDPGFLLPYVVHRKLFEWQFDLFGLLMEGLAVSNHEI